MKINSKTPRKTVMQSPKGFENTNFMCVMILQRMVPNQLSGKAGPGHFLLDIVPLRG